MSNAQLETAIEAAWEVRDTITPATTGEARDAIEETLNALDSGMLRVAEKQESGDWRVNQWAKKAVLLGFRIKDMEEQSGGPQGSGWWDKVDSKFKGWSADDWKTAGFRAVPNCVVRRSAYIAPGAVLMPSFVNLGAYVGEGTMVDTWATVGSCAQIGKGVHLSGGVGIGGVLEPPQGAPVIIEDNAFLGSRAIVVEGVLVEEGAVLGANVVITASTPIIDVTGSSEVITKGRVPAGSVVIPGTRMKEFPAGSYGTPAALIIGKRKDSTDKKTTLEKALRDYEVSV
ncbi:MAG: 2,3,4,5-tetrahydropyridine-2,6-dicarboxylate N-succinyltransferase [Leptospirales bacterium]